jgi:hypothetical protein
MAKLMAVLTAALLVLGISGSGASAAWRHHECRYQTLDGRSGWSRDEVRRTILCATHKYGVSTSTALYVADRESSLYARARNTSSGACGIFQHMPRYWPSRIGTVERSWRWMQPFGHSCYDARSNILAAMYMVKHSGWGPWSL